ncbi:Trm112 family protein [Candidatus Nitrosopelagicus sp.]|nr:Trm112 family protein [Candidatus Nitrosopelagicus sp.]
MKNKLLDILACPMCKNHPLELLAIKSKNDEVEEGAIYCTSCERYFLIIEEIPIMLPDELRDKKQEEEFLKKNKDSLPEKITKQGKPWHL